MDVVTVVSVLGVGISVVAVMLGSTWFLARKFQYYDDKICFINKRLDNIENKLDTHFEILRMKFD